MPLKDEDMPGLFLKWAKGDEEAADMMLAVARATRLADDIGDGDTSGPNAVADLLVLLIEELGGNPFFIRHREGLTVALMNAVRGWQLSEHYRHSDLRKTRMFGFVMRENIETFVHAVAQICGGYAHSLAVAVHLHELMHGSNDETFEDWEAE